ncbi:mitochondrial ornithine transporter 1 [Neodiprion virginianus]|uniref:Mitochondrial ornithine transporter 1 n=1 Tax=Neodiprion lecontei TaxID=441921 RepID=A0A6J0BH97_NEOLC|nr:mitochondrial ornithine transporter 1 [Neodiprion lecontei]XP_046432761.1 mitochondrial ornithine transporter 1 [Neodiprion fabricii]XP_046625981.1 mitochondrial ornithine transporter 1 [Neodiprion virginianus]
MAMEHKDDHGTLKSPKNLKSGIIDFTAGSLGGVTLVYVGQPLDTVKVKMQTFPQLYKGMIDCFMKTLKQDGIVRGLYAGTIPALVANVAENSVLFAAYGLCQNAIANLTGVQKVEDLSLLGNAWAGFFAAFFSSLSLCPTELIKCQLQAMREVETQKAAPGERVNFIGPWQLTKQIVRAEGPQGLFRGLLSTIGREMPGYFCFFGGYETTRQLLAKPGQNKEDIGWINTMIAGAAGGVIFWLVIFPADVIKSRIQVQNLRKPVYIILKDVVRTEGIGALYNGLKPTLIRTVPATATLFVTYEYSKGLMHKYFDD